MPGISYCVPTPSLAGVPTLGTQVTSLLLGGVIGWYLGLIILSGFLVVWFISGLHVTSLAPGGGGVHDDLDPDPTAPGPHILLS